MMQFICFMGLSILFFLIDITFLGFSKSSFFCQALFYSLIVMEKQPLYLFLAGIFVLMQTFILQGTLGIDLMVMIPLALLLYYIRAVTELTIMQKAILIGLCVIGNYKVITVGIGGMRAFS